MFIAYTDPLDIFTNRDTYCRKEYKFECDCPRCTKSRDSRAQVCDGSLMKQAKHRDDDYDSLSETLKCQTKGCSGLCYDYAIPNLCEFCGESQEISYQRVKYLRDEALIAVNIIAQKIAQLNCAQGIITLEEVRTIEKCYAEMKRYCPPTSYYVQEAGRVLVDVLLNRIGLQSNDEGEIRRLCSQALGILEELNNDSNAQMLTSLSNLPNVFNQLKIAKLLLFLSPDPSRAITILQSSKALLSIFFPPGHEVISQAEELLMSAYS